MNVKDFRLELDKYDDEYEICIGESNVFEFVVIDDDKVLSIVPIA